MPVDLLDPLSRVLIRGSSPRLALEMLNERGAKGQVERHMGEQAFAELSAYGDSAWVPMTLYAPFVRAVYETQGNTDKDAVAFWRQHGTRIMASPLLKGIVATGRALFGVSPLAIFKIAPRGWGLTYKNFGRMQVAVKEDGTHREALLTVSGGPPQLCQESWFALGHVGTFWAILDLFDITGTAEMTALDPGGSFTIRVRYDV